MSNTVPAHVRRSIAFGATGLAASFAAAIPVPAHATDGGPLIQPGETINVRQLLSAPAGSVGELGLSQLPVVGTLPDTLDGLPVKVVPTVVPALLKGPETRMRASADAPLAPGAPGLGILPLMSHVPLVDRQQSEALLQNLVGSVGALGPLSSLTGGLGGIAAF